MNRYDLVILGLLKEGERSGYDIINWIKQNDLNRWAKITVSTVYNRLVVLKKKDLIDGRTEKEGNRPERTVYQISDKGKEVLAAEVVRHLTGFNDDPRTLGFAFLYGADLQKAKEALEKHADNLLNEINAIQILIDEEPQPTFCSEGPFLNCMSRDHMGVELKYIRAAIDILGKPENCEQLTSYWAINHGAS